MLLEFITAHREAIVARAREKAAKRPWPAVSTDELETGIPLFLTQLAETLRLTGTSEPFSPEAIGDSASKHGGDLLGKGFTVAQVVHDYGDICQGITELAVEEQATIRPHEFQILNLCLDNAIAGAVTEYSRRREHTLGERERERLGQLSHELRNSLSTAMLAYYALKSGRVAIGGSTGAILGRSLASLRDLVDTTISEVRLAAGTHAAKNISVARLLHEVEGAASLQARDRELDVAYEPPPEALVVSADPQLLASAVFNLIQNAFKYTVAHGRVTLRTTREDGRVRIEIEDECGGLPDQNAETFFSPFGERRGKDRSGLGLGLSISRKAVRTFGGDIVVRNLPGKGCVFAIELPIVQE